MAADTTKPRPLSERAAAEYLRIDRATLRRLRIEERAPRHTMIGDRPRYEVEDLDAYKAAHTHQGAA